MKDADIQRLWDEAQKERQALQRGVEATLSERAAAGCRCHMCQNPLGWVPFTFYSSDTSYPRGPGLGHTGSLGCKCSGCAPVDFAINNERIAKTEYFDWHAPSQQKGPVGLTIPIPSGMAPELLKAIVWNDTDQKWTAWGWPTRSERWPDSPMAQAEMSDSQTIVPAADDVGFIAKRLKELAAERAEEAKNSDPELATEKHLDQIGENWGVMRNPCESDYTYRQRLLRAGGWIV